MVLGLMILSLFFQWGLLFYFYYFGTAPEIMVLLNNIAEGAAVGDAIWALVPWKFLLFLAPVLILKIFLLYRYAIPVVSYHQRLKWACCCALTFLTLFGTLDILSRSSVGRTGIGSRCAKLGFLPVFAQDIVFRYCNLSKLHEQALENESQWSLGLQSEYTEYSFGDIVVIQVETLDNAVINHHVNGKPVVPFLNSLQDNSLTYRLLVQPYGSAGADFAFLNGISALAGFFNYALPGLHYNTALPRFFNNQRLRHIFLSRCLWLILQPQAGL